MTPTLYLLVHVLLPIRLVLTQSSMLASLPVHDTDDRRVRP